MLRIDTKRCRDVLAARREPYWYKLSRGRYLGLRKLANGHGAWIARYRDEDGAQSYKALGEYSETFEFDQAKEAAENWFRDVERGISGRNDDGTAPTVGTACITYVRSLRAEGRLATAHDAHMRFRRTVYGDVADAEFSPAKATLTSATDAGRKRKRKKPVAHPIASVPLPKVRAVRLREWHSELVDAGLTKATANRTLGSVKAALNLAVRDRKVSAAVAQEWIEVEQFKDAGRRRELFLDLAQRQALLASAEGAVRDLIEGTMLTGCRAGELTSARRAAFDARTKSLIVTGKTGTRTMPLAPSSLDLFTRLAQDKLPAAYLLMRDDGKPWAHSDWDELVREAATKAELPKGTCLYTLRHSFITEALLNGMSTLEVTRIVGTSLAMIEKHYGHLVNDTARERLAKVQMV